MGLAEATGLPVLTKRIRIRRPWRWLPPGLWPAALRAIDPAGDGLKPPWPDLVIASGRMSVAPAAAIRRASDGHSFCVQIQSPRIDSRRFDLVVVPEHDRLRGANVIPTVGALHRVTPDRLREGKARFEAELASLPRPLVAVLLGGSNSAYRLDAAAATILGRQLKALASDYGAGLAITASRRTGHDVLATLRDLLGSEAYFWTGCGDNPYFGLLALADAILVTADSVSMTSEACATGKPVYVIPLAGRSRKIEAFHEGLGRRGMTRRFDGSLDFWSYSPLDETARVATIVRERLHLRHSSD